MGHKHFRVNEANIHQRVVHKILKVVTFQLSTEKKFTLNKKMFDQILKLLNVGRFYEDSNEQVIRMFNEMGYQPTLTKISNFKKSSLLCIWNFLFGIFHRCLTGRTVGLDKAKLQIYTMVAGI